MERIRSVSEDQWALKRGVLKSPVIGFALCPMNDLNQSHKEHHK